MLLHLDPSSGVPVYLRLEAQVTWLPGPCAPWMRFLLRESWPRSCASIRTPSRGKDLEQDGVTRSVPGGGTYVADGLPGLLKSEKVKRLRPHARQLAVEGRPLRLTREETLKLLEEELDKLGGQP